MGSILPTLSLLVLVLRTQYNVNDNNLNFDANDNDNDEINMSPSMNMSTSTSMNMSTSKMNLLLYVALFASVGLSFASTSFFSIMYSLRKCSASTNTNTNTITSASSDASTNMSHDNVNEPNTDTNINININISTTPILIMYSICIAIFIQMLISISASTMMTTPYIQTFLQIIIIFSTIVFICLYIYDDAHNYNYKYNYKYKENKEIKRITVLQRVFTMGEWITISCFISLFITDYIIRYWYMPYKLLSLFHDGDRIKDMTDHTSLTLDQAYISVSHAGIVGCIIGCIIPISYLSSMIQQKFSNTKKETTRNGVPQTRTQTILIPCLFRIIIVVMSVLTCINSSLYHNCVLNYNVNGNIDHNTNWCYRIAQLDNCYDDENDNSKKSILVGQVLNYISITPTALIWLIDFLISSDDDTDKEILGINLSTIPRYSWLCYWVIVLLFTLPIAIIIAKTLSQYAKTSKQKKTKLTIVARKYFHFIALLLFGPPTYYAPTMMFLSYAIASALLFLVESLRFIYYQEVAVPSSSTNDSSSSKIKAREKSTTEAIPTKHNQIKDKEIRSFTVNDFFQTFFDEKDFGAMDGGFVVTHVALIVGCALPLWFKSCYDMITDEQDLHDGVVDHEERLFMMPYLGIVTLGIGDAAGAIYGSFFGKTKWPESRRTVEGSLAMLVTMEICVVIFRLWNYMNTSIISLSYDVIGKEFVFVLIPVVILEAVTSQIDNLCLPLFSVVLCCLVF